MNVVAIGKGAVGTRYIAERDANQEREGNSRRPLFSEERDGLTPAKANHVLTDGNGKPRKVDVRHLVISPESARAYESLGDTDEERRDNFRDSTRATMARFAESLGVKDLRWVAGIHLNTDHPHVHILFHKEATDLETGRPRRIEHIPKEWLMHNEGIAVEHDSVELGKGVDDMAGKILAYRSGGEGPENFQQFNGAYLTLEKQGRSEDGNKEKLVVVAVEAKDIFDPKGVLEGSDKERSSVDEKRMLARLEGVPLHSFRETQTEVLAEFGYRAAVDWEGGERDDKEPRRELIVFDKSLVVGAAVEPEIGVEGRGRDDASIQEEQGVRVNYGQLGVYFKEELEERAYPVRQIAFHIDHSEDYTRRGLLDPREHKPTETERLVGRWVMLEARQNGHEDVGTRILRLRLREEVGKLDAGTIERSEPRPVAYIPINKLQDAIADRHLEVLRSDGTLAPRYHTSEPSSADISRARILDMQPAHGGQIYGVITADSNRLIAREVVTVSQHLRVPAPEPVGRIEAAAVEAGAGQIERDAQARQSSEVSRLGGVEGRRDVGWNLTVYVDENNRAEFAERLSELREKNGVAFNYGITLDKEEGRGITVSMSDQEGKEEGVSHTVQEKDGFSNDDVVIIHAGSRDNADMVAGLIQSDLSELMLDQPEFSVEGEELERRFSEKVGGFFRVEGIDRDFSASTKNGVPFVREDAEIFAGRGSVDIGVEAGSLSERRDVALDRADGLLKERYGVFYAGGKYIAPERSAPEQTQQAVGYEPQQLKGGKTEWIHVTPDEPCPVCKKPDNCAVSTDSKQVYCRRIESPKQGRDGGWFHDATKIADYTPQAEREGGPSVVQYEKRPIEDRDRVNRKIMAALSLGERDLENLLGRGLTQDAIERDGYVSVPIRAKANQIAERLAGEGEDLRGVPGFWKATDEAGDSKWQLNLNYWYRGIMVPVTDAQGHVDGFQIRRAEIAADEPKYVWLSSKTREDSPRPEGTPSGAPIHFTSVEQAKESGEIILTEGSLKANIISNYLDRSVVAIAGVSVFQDDFGERLKNDIPELTRVWVAYDADATEKKEVQKALERVTGVLAKAGLEVGQLSWRLEDGKGLDDYLQNKLGANFHQVQGEERGEQQIKVLVEVGWTNGEIPDERRPAPSFTLKQGMVDEENGKVITGEELTVSRWLQREAQAADQGLNSSLRGLRSSVRDIDTATQGDKSPEVPAVMQGRELEEILRGGNLLTHDQLIERQLMLDRVTLGKEIAARLELVHAGVKYNRCVEQAETRRYRVLDASTGINREISERDIEQRAQARSYRVAEERATEVEQADPKDRRSLRNEIKEGVITGDLAEHESTVEDIGRKHSEQLSSLDRNLRRAYLEHDDLAPQAHAVERAYRARGEDMPSPMMPEDTIDRLHDQAVERRDVDTIKTLDQIRTRIAQEHGVPARDDERAARLAAQHAVAGSDLKVAQNRESEFRESSHNRRFEIEGEGKKWSLAEVDKEHSQKGRELEYLNTSGRFLGSRGFAATMFKQHILQHFNPLNALRPSSLSPLYPIINSPVGKAVRMGIQVYKWYERGQEAKLAREAAIEAVVKLNELRPKILEKIAERQAELVSEVKTQQNVTEALEEIQGRETATREARGLEKAQAKYSDWELKRLESNAMELRDGDVLHEYERAASERVTGEVEKLNADLAAGKTPEDAARELVENRIKDSMSQLEPSPKQIITLTEEGAEVPANRMLASEKIEELNGEEAVWKKAGREAVEALKSSGERLTPESLLEAHRTSFGGRAVAREVVAEVRMKDAASRLDQFKEFRNVTQVRYTTSEGIEQAGSLKETEPKSWLDGLKRWLSESPADLEKRTGIERALVEEEARLTGAHEEARDFHEAVQTIAEEYRVQLPGAELEPQFTSKEASEIERFGGGLRPDELASLEQLGDLTSEQAEQVQYSRIIQDALLDGRVENDPSAQPAQRAGAEQKEANPVEREARQLAENPELAEGAASDAAAAIVAETEVEIEEGLSLLM